MWPLSNNNFSFSSRWRWWQIRQIIQIGFQWFFSHWWWSINCSIFNLFFRSNNGDGSQFATFSIKMNTSGLLHGGWKSQKKSHSTLQAKRATFTWVDKKWLKWPKMTNFDEFLKTLILRSNSVTRQVTFNKQKLVKNAKIQKFKCDILGDFQSLCLLCSFFISGIFVHFWFRNTSPHFYSFRCTCHVQAVQVQMRISARWNRRSRKGLDR